MPINANIPLMAAQPVAGVRDAVGNGFNEYYRAKNDTRQNRLFDLNVQSNAADQERKNALFEMNKEKHQIAMDEAARGQLYRMAKGLKALPAEQRQAEWESYVPQLRNMGFSEAQIAEGIDTDEELDAVLAAFGSSSDLTSDQKSFNSLTNTLQGALDENGRFVPEKATASQLAAAVELGIAPRVGLSAAERIATNEQLGNQIADQGAREEKAKLETQLEMKPKIQAAVKEAETIAASRGETLNEYERAKAALPGLQEVTGKLKALADIATYTMSGKAFDFMAKELGFGSTEGSTARAKMTSLVDNQILPLLRDTFGAAFTAAEGDRLRNAMLDPDSSPEAKKATLDSFLAQRIRNLEAKQAELGINPGEQVSEDSQALEWARANPNDPRAQQIIQLNGGQ